MNSDQGHCIPKRMGPSWDDLDRLCSAQASPLERLSILAKCPELEATQVPLEIQELAEAITDGCDGPGIEPTSLELLLKIALYLDRRAT